MKKAKTYLYPVTVAGLYDGDCDNCIGVGTSWKLAEKIVKACVANLKNAAVPGDMFMIVRVEADKFYVSPPYEPGDKPSFDPYRDERHRIRWYNCKGRQIKRMPRGH